MADDPNDPNYDPSAYHPKDVPGINANYSSAVHNLQNYANRSTGEFQNDLNQGVREQSNLMGPSQGQDPESQALSARANQYYNSHLNQMTRNSVVPATQRQIGLQGNAIDNNAALYSNYQSRQALQYQQVSYKREAAITDAGIRYQMMNSIFQGVGFAGAFAAKGLYNVMKKSASEEDDSEGG